MASTDTQRFLIPLLVWLLAGALSLGLFIVWANQPKLVDRDWGAGIGALATLVSVGALTEVMRRAIQPKLILVTIGIYVVGVLASAGIAFVYALFFTVFHAKDF